MVVTTKSNDPSVKAVRGTVRSLRSVRLALAPFLTTLSRDAADHNTTTDPLAVAEAEAAVALTVGSLRYTHARLSGRKADDALKAELDGMKRVVVRLLQRRKKRDAARTAPKEEKDRGK